MVLVLGRAAVGAVVLIPMTLLGLGVADVAAFNSRATSLEQSWRADESAGVSAADLAPARASLRDLRERRIASVIPYSAFSGALLTDPFRTPESQALARVRDYLRLAYPRQGEQPAGGAGAIKSAADTVQHRVDTHAQADQMMGQIPSLLDQAAKYGVTADFPARTGQAKSNVQ